MASSHSSQSVPHPSNIDNMFKKDMDSSKHFKLVRSLPDVCPKEPTGDLHSLCDPPSIVADQHEWTVYDSKVNLPAALNDPRLVKRESDFFTKTWGADFIESEVMPSPYLPNVTKEDFASYLKETSKVFMKPDFALDDPLTFNVVLPWSHFSGAAGKGSRVVGSSRLLQEKLIHYLDVVEVNIAHQISLRSEAFFHAMTSQHELQDYLRETSQAVKVLRDKICHIDNVMCKESLHILRQAMTRKNCVMLYNKLKLMATVQQTQPTVQLLLSTSDFVGALDLIATTQEVLQQELQGIHSLRHLGSQLCELEKLIGKMMIADFSTYARRDLSRSLEEENQVLEECVISTVSYIEEIDPEVVVNDAFGEVEQCSLETEIKNQRTLTVNSEPSGSDSTSDQECTTESSSSREQSSSSVTPGGVEITINEDMKLTDLELGGIADSIQKLLYTASDVCHDRCVKFLMARAKDGFLEKLNSSEFVALSRAVEAFAQETESICGRKSMSLRVALQSQANKIVHRFHDERKTKLSLLLDNERWKQAEVPAEFQDLVNSIEDGKISLPEKKTSGSEERKPADYLIVDGQKYAVVGTVLLLIRIFLEYCQCVDDIPSITTDMLTRLSDLLKEYNDHIAEISAKLVAIMDSLFEKVLTKMLFLRINASFKLHLKKQLTRLAVVNDGGPQHGLVMADVAFYTGNIQALKTLENLDLNMAEIWKQKR
ncbi:VPS54 protein, partial [Polypterus senegalus]